MSIATPLRYVLHAMAFTLGLAIIHPPGPAFAQELELIGSARTTHQTLSLTFRLSPGQSPLSEIRVRSGSLALHLEAVEIVFADGSLERAIVQESLGPGHQSRPIRIGNRQAVREIHISKRPGMRPGETTLQILGRLAQDR